MHVLFLKLMMVASSQLIICEFISRTMCSLRLHNMFRRWFTTDTA